MSSRKKRIRAAFRQAVYRRDGYACVTCGHAPADVDDLDAHHITDRHAMPHGGYVAENGITLCADCHLKAELWHSSGHSVWEEGFHPDELYAAVGSSFEEARRASERLA